MNSYAIIMAGGNGERFWPLSTPERPKQFLDLFGGRPLIAQAVDRLAGLLPPERIFVVTADRFVGLTREALPDLPSANILGEPCRRDTAAAVATACGLVLRNGGADAVGCILTADTLIGPVADYQRELADAMKVAASRDAIVTMGIHPTRPETGFGYIECGEREAGGENGPAADVSTAFCEVKRFVEKPDLETARSYLASGRFLWNAGMFIWKASVMREAFRAHAPDLAPLVDAVAGAANPKEAIDRLYPSLRSISIDFAVMERVKRMIVAKATFGWDDVGSWTAVGKHFPADAKGNVAIGSCTLRNCTGVTAVNRADDGQVLVLAGLTDAVVVHTPAATFVAAKSETGNMKEIVRSLVAKQ